MDTVAVREFAIKKLQEARERGTELATVTAARAALSISNSVPVSSSFIFRSSSLAEHEQQLRVPLERKLGKLKRSNDSLRSSLAGRSTGTLDESISKLDLINESLVFTFENIREGSHVTKLLKQQLKDNVAMQNPRHKTFYQKSRS
ncbi:hypothetical protein PsorP6_008741 [Peronosclerospora sorghi]|uniref:Uncharacterized protein n=1 Tax=Peronosclerospora sorghi TaxID=230839 RepID=A0ACC0VZB2_9STRA|nr:hypothetical protein PsorP6_008741 [Peronosclerospora sorghi]